MDIRRNINLNKLVYLVLICVTPNPSEGASARSITTDQKPPSSKITFQEASQTIDRLEKTPKACEKSYAYFESKYRLGLSYFKAHMMSEAKTEFLQITNDPNCPEIIHIFGLNMAGQISRLMGENNDALEVFDQLLKIVEQSSSNTLFVNPVLVKLGCCALIARAEIYDFNRNFDLSIAQYNRLLSFLNRNQDTNLLNHYKPFVSDRISQLLLKNGDFEKYWNSAQTLTTTYPHYYRTPVIKLEMECTSLLKTIDPNSSFSDGSFESPAQTIFYFKNSQDQIRARPFMNKLQMLCGEYQNTYGDILLRYHYAWLLDTFDEKNEAAKTFEQVFSADILNANKLESKAIIETVKNYARIQYVILLKEKGDYREALNALPILETQSNNSHLTEITNSVRRNVQTFMREVLRNETK